MQRRPSKPKPARMEPGLVDLGDLRRLKPVSQDWGFDRGRPIDRHYIERFLEARSKVIRGRVLEIGEPLYTEMFGRGVTQSEILDVMGNPDATYTCGLDNGAGLPTNSFDCIIVTQTLQYIYDFRAALRTLHRILKRGGILLVTVPGITRLNQGNPQEEDWYWSFTDVSITSLFEELFPHRAITVEIFGNVLSATGFLYGLADAEFDSQELGHVDPNYQVIIGAHAVK